MSFTLTAGYTFSAGDVVTATRLNTLPTVADNQLYKFSDGTAAAPSVTFNSDSDNGFYYIAANNFGIACNGTTIGNFSTTGLNNIVIGATTPLAGSFTTLTTTGVTAVSMSATAPFIKFTGSTATQVWNEGDAGGFGGTAGHFSIYDATNAKNIIDITANGGAIAVTSTAVTMSGTLTITGAVTGLSFNATSGRRFKENITRLNHCLDAVLALRPVRYDMIQGAKEQIGFIAEEVGEIEPSVIGPDKESLDYSKLTAVLAGAVQELSARMNRAGI